LTGMDYAGVLEADAGDAMAPAGYNGAEARVDLAQPLTHVSKANMLVFTDGNQVHLGHSWAWCIYAAQGFPVAATAVTPGHMETAGSRLKDIAIIHSTLAFMSHITVNGVALIQDVRTDDGLSQVQADTLFAQNGPGAPCLVAANQLWAHLDGNGQARVRFYAESKMCIMLLCMNQMHRELCELHQWYTNAAIDPKSQTGRCTAMAGAAKEEFMTYVAIKNRGHDTWHFLGNTSLENVAYAIVGKQDGVLEVAQEFVYLGETIEAGEVVVAEYLVTSASVKDRLPSGTIGVSGLIVGVQFVAQMFESLESKSTVVGGEGTVVAINSVKDFLASTTLTRAELLRLKTAFLPLVATAVGYKSLTAAGRDDVAAYEGLSGFVKQDIKNSGRGKMLAEAFEKIQVTPDKLASVVRAIHMEARVAFAALVTAGAIDVPMAVIGNVTVEQTPDQKREARAEREEAIRLERMAVSGP